MEQKLTAGLGKGQISEFIEHDEVHPGQVERSLTSVWLIGAPSNWKSVMSLASGSLAMVSWYLIDRACFSLNLGAEQIADDALGLVLSLDGSHHDLVEGSLHAIELEFAHEIEQLGTLH
jgi:hypothetical protein